MLRKKTLIRFVTPVVVMLAAVTLAPAQSPAAGKNELAGFEKSIEQGKYAEIERDLLNYAIRNPADADGFELLARLRFLQNRLAEARSLYQKVLSLAPGSAAAKINLAVIDFRSGNHAPAAAALGEIPESEISGDALRLRLAQALALVGDCKGALRAVEKLTAKTRNGEALPLRARCHLSGSDRQPVEPLIPTAKNLARDNPAAAIEFADALFGAAMFKEAADVLRAVVRTSAQNVDALVLLAKTEIFLRDFANAKIHLEQVSRLDAESPELFFARALFDSEQGKNKEALEPLEKALAVRPDSPVFLRQYVVSAMRASQPGKAVKAAEKLWRQNPDDPAFLYLYGAASLQNNSIPAAESALEKYHGLRPDDPVGCVAFGLALAAQTDKLDAARRQMERCIALAPGNYEAKYQLGLSYKAQGETDKAIEYLEATIAASPDYATALRDLGTVYLQTGAEAKARGVLEKSAALAPDDADTHFQLSRLYNLLGETDLAKKHLEIFQSLRNPKKEGM